MSKVSDLERAFAEDGERKTHVGGQALLEGIMMRGKLNWAVAVRKPDGSIHVEEHDLASGRKQNSWLTWPFVRGCTALVESLMLGFKALAIANLLVGEYDARTLAWNLVDGIVRVAIFVFYLWLIGRMSDIKRMFMYHGAEHKTIHCYEHGLPLTPDNARRFPRLHVRCGTAFLIMVMIIAIIVYTIVPLNALISALGVPDGAPKFALVVVVRVLLMPLIAGISYEITVKWAGSHPENPLVKVILWPGMQMQYLTTNEPDDGQLECAIAAMERVLEREERAAGEAAAARGGEKEKATA